MSCVLKFPKPFHHDFPEFPTDKLFVINNRSFGSGSRFRKIFTSLSGHEWRSCNVTRQQNISDNPLQPSCHTWPSSHLKYTLWQYNQNKLFPYLIRIMLRPCYDMIHLISAQPIAIYRFTWTHFNSTFRMLK